MERKIIHRLEQLAFNTNEKVSNDLDDQYIELSEISPKTSINSLIKGTITAHVLKSNRLLGFNLILS